MPDEPEGGGRFETLLATLLGIAAVATAFSAYQAEMKGGEATAAFHEATLSMTDAAAVLNAGLIEITRDQGLFLEYAKANLEDNHDLARYVRVNLMDGNLRAGLREWERSPDDTGPLTAMDAEAYKTESLDEASETVDETQRLFDQAGAADEEGDRYVLISVFLAVALFFLGLAGVLRIRRTRISMAVIGVSVLALSLVLLVPA